MVMTEERISRLEGAYEQVDRRLGDLTQAVAGLRAEIVSLRQSMSDQGDALRAEMGEQGNALRAEMSEQNSALRSEMNSRLNTLLVVGGGVGVTTMGLIIGLYLQN